MKDMSEHRGPVGPNDLSVEVMGRLHWAARRSWLAPQDVDMMQRHLEHCETQRSGVTALIGEILRQKLSQAGRLGAEASSEGIATGNTVLGYRLCGDQPPIIARLSYRVRLREEPGVVPLRSLLGATLIGMAVGETAPLLLSDGSLTEVTLSDLHGSARECRVVRLPVAAAGRGGILPA
ncbi:hypothetical protein [Pseudodonghicola xiamenensis]|uniref:Uncharacterized protein n=1 Tax=Pseudodonghicola xiamenensis TaxID=337702 RepID=A0A8J3H8C9_9RHOB|nr:hypothetical protein [Pseudodonghicola xiamenensis]GHG90861.1 hypothetical protein GCM10010961_21900 [Pseudodonghicola xiamenensis]